MAVRPAGARGAAYNAPMNSCDVAVHGGGIVGRTLALELASHGLEVALLAPTPRAGADLRAYALNAASVALLQRLRVWSQLPADAATAVHEMRVHGDARASRIEFSAWTQHVEQLAHIVDAAALEATLADAVRFAPRVHAMAADDSPRARLHAWCDGKFSAGRERLGVGFVAHRYGHTAVAARLVASQPHAGVARQWFRAPDVLALLPFDHAQRGCGYGLVWSLPEARAQALLHADTQAFEAALNDATGGEAGALALAHGDDAQLILGGPVLGHVPARRECVGRVRAEVAGSRIEPGHPARPLGVAGRAAVGRPRRASFPQRRIREHAEHVVRHPRRDRHRRVLHHLRGGRSRGIHVIEQPQVLHAQVVLQTEGEPPSGGARDPGVDQQAIDLIFSQARVGQRRSGGIGGQLQGGFVNTPHRRHPEASNGRGATQRMSHAAGPPGSDSTRLRARRHPQKR